MAWHWPGDKPLSKPMLEYCKLNLKNKLQWNVNQNSYIFTQENVFENVVCEVAAILPLPQFVKMVP